jgi:transcriptional regulator with XRE-family HTH domain
MSLTNSWVFGRMMDDLQSFGGTVKKLRQALNLSQEQLAAECELDRTYISGIERGQRNVGLKNIYKLAKALEVHPSKLFAGDQDAI